MRRSGFLIFTSLILVCVIFLFWNTKENSAPDIEIFARALKKEFPALHNMHVCALGKPEEKLNALGALAVSYIDPIQNLADITCDLLVACNLPPRMNKKILEQIDAPCGFFSLKNLADAEKLIPCLLAQKKRGRVTQDGITILSWKPQDAEEAYPKKGVPKGSAVTYTLSGGRLGDNFLAYFHARWVAFKYGIPLLYVPFPFSDSLGLHDESTLVGSLPQFEVTSEEQMLHAKEKTLFIIPYFSEAPFEFGRALAKPIHVEWNHSGFREEIKHYLEPKFFVKTLDLPSDRLTIAVHVRKGKKPRGGADGRKARQAFPLKFPPDAFYVEEIRRTIALFPDKPLYFYIFTDYPHPERLVHRYRHIFANSHAQFVSKAKEELEAHPFEDFFSMTKFDCLIYCHSNFSVMASKLGNYLYTSLPMHCFRKGRFVAIDGVELTFNGAYLR